MDDSERDENAPANEATVKHKIETHGNKQLVDRHLEFLYNQNQDMLAADQRMRDDIAELKARDSRVGFVRRIFNRWRSRRAGKRPS